MGKATRDAYGEALKELGAVNPDIVVLDADLSASTKTQVFAKAYPDRFFDTGIAEGNMMGVAAGLAAAGKIHSLRHLLFSVRAERMNRSETPSATRN